MYAFHILLSYIYSDKIPAVDPNRCLELLELANRLCMNRLVNLVEARVIDQLQQRDRYLHLTNSGSRESSKILFIFVYVRILILQGMW